jgi:hypothetical protein
VERGKRGNMGEIKPVKTPERIQMDTNGYKWIQKKSPKSLNYLIVNVVIINAVKIRLRKTFSNAKTQKNGNDYI